MGVLCLTSRVPGFETLWAWAIVVVNIFNKMLFFWPSTREVSRWCDRQEIRNGMTPVKYPLWIPAMESQDDSFPTPWLGHSVPIAPAS